MSAKTGFALMSQQRRKEVAAMGGRKSRGGGVTGNPARARQIGKLGGRPTKEPFFIKDEGIDSHIIEPFVKPKFWGWFRRHK